jgi:GntR family transcriptional regulator
MAANTKVDTIIDGIRSRILSGEFGEEGRLPSFRKLVDEYQTSQETMNKAMQSLQAEGLLLSAGAKGVFVNKPRLRMPLVFIDFSKYLTEQGYKTIITEFIDKPEVVTPSNELKKRMLLKKGELVVRRNRKQGADNIIFRLVDDYFPMSLMTDSMLEEIIKDPNFNVLLAIKENFGEIIEHVDEELIARLPTSSEQEQLKIVRTNPIISTHITNFDKNRKIVVNANNKILNANHFLLTYEHPIDFWK